MNCCAGRVWWEATERATGNQRSQTGAQKRGQRRGNVNFSVKGRMSESKEDKSP